MSTIKIINNLSDEHKVSIGNNTLAFMSSQTKLDDEGKTIVIDEAMHILRKCIAPGVKSDITNIAVGYVQSGKTLSFTTLTALAADNGYRIVIYLTGTKTNLQSQTTKRLRNDLEVDESDTYRLYSDIVKDVNVANNVSNFLTKTKEVLLFPILKHYLHINRLADIFNDIAPVIEKMGAIIIDDEADQSSFNTYARKNARTKGEWEEDEYSRTYSAIINLKKSLPSHSYVQYTATPQAAFLINNNDILSPKYHTVLTPGKGYTGGKVFFKEKDRDIIQVIPNEEVYSRDNILTSLPASLEEAIREFLISVAIKVFLQKSMKFLSMMVHIDGKRESNEKFAKWISYYIQKLMDFASAQEGDPSQVIYKKTMEKSYNRIVSKISTKTSFEEVISTIPKVILYTKIHLIQGNSENDVDWKSDKAHILVGADMLNRGFTVENLSMTYMPRTPKGKATADTIEQRCRFFGYKKAYLDICRVFLPTKSIQEYNDYVDHEEVLRANLKQCESLEEFHRHRSSMLLAETLNPTRSNILSNDVIRTKMTGWKQMRSLDYVNDNNIKFESFLKEIASEQFVLFHDYDGNPKRNHRYFRCPIDQFISFFKEVKFGDVPNITRKIVTIQYLFYLKNIRNIDYIYIFQMAYAAEKTGQLRTRKLEKDQNRPINLMAGRAANGSYPGDDNVKLEDSVSVQIHHIEIDHPLSKWHKTKLYNLSFYYPMDISNSFIGIEDANEDDYDD